MMKTLLLNPPSYEGFDGGASSRWPASREVASFWYPVWLCYPAGFIPNSRVLDCGPHNIGVKETLQIAQDYEFVVLFTSTPSFQNDVRLAEAIKNQRPDTLIAFVGPHVSVLPEKSLQASEAIDMVCIREFDYSVKEIAEGRPWETVEGIAYRKGSRIYRNPDRPAIQDLDALPFVTPIYKRDLDIKQYNVPFLLHPYISFYTERGCPAQCTFCLWPQTFSGHAWRVRSTPNVVEEVKLALNLFPEIKEIFFDDDTFTIRKSRVLELCQEFKKIGFTWSCNSRVTTDFETLKAMKEAGCRLLIVGFESGDPQILKNIKKGASIERARQFVKDCKRLGIKIHGDFIIGLPGETPETIERSIRFACELDVDTIQVSIAQAYPGTALYRYLEQNNYFVNDNCLDEEGRVLANFEYPGLNRRQIYEAVETFYKRYYYRPRVVARIVGRALFNGEERSRLYKEAKEWFAYLKHRRQVLASQRFS